MNQIIIINITLLTLRNGLRTYNDLETATANGTPNKGYTLPESLGQSEKINKQISINSLIICKCAKVI